MKLGFHNSIQGGLHMAVVRAFELGTDCLQLFLHSPRSWSTTNISDKDREIFKETLRKTAIGPVFAHASYLINLASQDKRLWHASVNLLKREIQMAEALGIKAVVVHPGRTKGAPLAEAMARVKEALRRLSSEVDLKRLVLENTAGRKGELGSSIEELLEMVNHLQEPPLGLCIDTAHAFSSGIDITDEATLKTIINGSGLPVVLIHLNDSKGPLGGKIDRHEHIGKGYIGLEGFKRILGILKETDLPLIMETPKKTPEDDRKNLQTVRSLLNQL
jgi:deoxyribonuclease-4